MGPAADKQEAILLVTEHDGGTYARIAKVDKSAGLTSRAPFAAHEASCQGVTAHRAEIEFPGPFPESVVRIEGAFRW
jgi:hypothetical protein